MFPLHWQNADPVTRQENGTSTGNIERLGRRLPVPSRKCFLRITGPCPTKFVPQRLSRTHCLHGIQMTRHSLAAGALFVVGLLLFAAAARAVPLGQPCGGPEGAACDKGLWCEPTEGACGSNAGMCVKVPRLCIARKHGKSFQPVCGCNNKTYSNDCFRRAYKVAKSHDGKC